MPGTNETLSVVEIIRNIPGDTTEPLLCKCSDGRRYVVKGYAGTSCEELIAEWVAANLAKRFGLSVPPFHIVAVPDALTAFMPQWRYSLQQGEAFASLYIENSAPLSQPQAHEAVNTQSQKLIYLFDRWINHTDRTFAGRSANMIYDFSSGRYYLVGHDRAFSLPGEQAEHGPHVYAPGERTWDFDLVDRNEGEQRVAMVINALDEILAGIPAAWSTGHEAFIGQVRRVLMRADDNEFWSSLS